MPNQQNIIFENVIALRPVVIERASYNAQFSLVGINSINGNGNWSSSFTGNLNELDRPLDIEFPLMGGGNYIAPGSPSISSLLGNLQISVVYPPATPLPTRPSTITNWKGIITLTGGGVIGVLGRQDSDVTPNLYNIKGCYSIKHDKGVTILSVKNITIF